MDISALCQREIVSISGNATLQQAASRMRAEHVGALVVTDPRETGRITGVVTDRDLVIEAMAQPAHAHPQEPTVGMLCNRPLVAVPSTSSVQDTVRAMRRSGVRRMLVMRPDGGLVGLVSADDLISAIADELETLAAALRGGIEQEDARTHAPVMAQQETRALYVDRD